MKKKSKNKQSQTHNGDKAMLASEVDWKWNSKVGRWESISKTIDGPISNGFPDEGPKPNNYDVLERYCAYLAEAIESAAVNPVSGKPLVDRHQYNLKLFIKQDLGNHVSSHKLKAMLKDYNDRKNGFTQKAARESGGKLTYTIHIRALPVGPRGARKQASQLFDAVDKHLNEKYSQGQLSIDFD
jgi:hypothetical protein